jgi:H+/gluconate symporter-like permease
MNKLDTMSRNPFEGVFNMTIEMTPALWWGLLGLTPLVIYIILVFRDVEILPATAICVVIGAVISRQSLLSFGVALADSMGSFLALVGLIIMLGRGLGEVLGASGVSHTIVHRIIHSIGVDTEKRAMLGIMAACLVMVGLLGTMAGGNAILAPIVLPIAAAVGLSRSTVGVIFQAVGEEALILGPFTPPVITLLGLTKIGYGEMLLYVSGPVALITLVVTWFMIQRIQRRTRESNPYEPPGETERFEPTTRSRRATRAFVGSFLAAVVYGIFAHAPTSFVIVIMLGLSFITGIAAGLKFDAILRLIVKGMAGNVGLFLLFLLLDPFIRFVEKAGGFAALTTLLRPMMESGGKPAIVITGGFLGAFGISGATVATLKLLHEMFNPLLSRYGVSMLAWSLALVVATRVHNFVFPGANMVSSLGFAESDDMKSLLRNGWLVAACQLTFLIIFSLIFA